MAGCTDGCFDVAAMGHVDRARIPAWRGWCEAVSEAEGRWKRLHRSIVEGVVELDELPKQRTMVPKAERETALADHDRANSTSGPDVTIEAEKVEAFGRLRRENRRTGDGRVRKDVIRSVLFGISAGDGRVRIIGDETVLAAFASGQRTKNRFVRGFVQDWRAVAGEDENRASFGRP